MNKSMIQKLFLILLPVLAVGLATAGDSVTVFNSQTSQMVTGSYFDLIPEAGNTQILPPLAASLAVVSAVLGILYMVKAQHGLLKGILWVSLLSASAASLPIALQGEATVIPNVMLPLLMCGQAWIAYAAGKKPPEDKPNTGRRLDQR